MPRLRRSDTAGPGFHRVRSGRGFTYRDPDGATLHDAELRTRFDALAIPPAWTDVWICPYPNGHVQATGVDQAGRRQYVYHPTWRARMDAIKYDRALALAEVLPAARRRVTMDLRREDLSRERALAAAFRMLDVANLRVGSEKYALAHGSFGLSTLLAAHATVSGGREVHLRFPAKSGQEWSSDVVDPDLAAFVARLKRRGGRARLLAWQDAKGWHPLSAEEINADVRARTGGDFTAKDFRTLHGTVAAAIELARRGPQPTTAKRNRAVAAAMRAAAEQLGNTPAIARASYVDPRVVDEYDEGRTIDPARLGSAESELLVLLHR
ncbi:MAG TPA: DNA topoisomerase [Micrococcales bacterium]|uniref:DNA topoisomerase IB n=1 Tax=Miniimonas arenae TaxID=676201 RepID=UPI000EDAD26E|nr:DNA topoisomerase IB [Miniimonas arenae]HCX84608.1 DNA topoisomerase [Micrococcales bacterium]